MRVSSVSGKELPDCLQKILGNLGFREAAPILTFGSFFFIVCFFCFLILLLLLFFFFTLQYCIGFAKHQHASATGVHVFPILNPPCHPIPSLWSFQCTNPKLPVSCIEPGLEIHFLYYTCFNAILPNHPLPPSPTESKRLFYTSVSLLLSRIQNWKRHMYPTVHHTLFIIARTWKQPRCPSADEWMRKLWCIYTMEYYSAIKKNTFEAVLMRWMKLEPILQSEVSQIEKHQIQYTNTYIRNLERW